jgi:hypothetical protein
MYLRFCANTNFHKTIHIGMLKDQFDSPFNQHVFVRDRHITAQPPPHSKSPKPKKLK